MEDSTEIAKGKEEAASTNHACPSETDGYVPEKFHTKCHDCGKFLKKSKWVPKDHPRKEHALCSECYSNYDGPEY